MLKDKAVNVRNLIDQIPQKEFRDMLIYEVEKYTEVTTSIVEALIRDNERLAAELSLYKIEKPL